MEQVSFVGKTLNNMLKSIHHQQKQKRGKRVSLPESSLNIDPWSWDTI
jgi:hypothetical protein